MLNGSDQIFDIIEEIAATSSKNDKEAMVKNAAKDSAFCQVLKCAYDPFMTYGIVPANPAGLPNGDGEFDVSTWNLIDDLAQRKLTGNAARDAVSAEFARLTDSSGQLLWRIIKKDLRAGFSESTINKAVKGLIPDFPYMRCTLPKDAKLDEFDWALGVLSQEKADGMFVNVDHEASGVVSLRSRQGSPFPIEAFAQLEDEVKKRLKAGTQSHGEMLVEKGGVICERQIGNGILNSILSGGSFQADEKPVLMLWDQIPLEAVVTKGKYDVSYLKRLNGIVGQLKATPGDAIKLIETRVYRSLSDAYTHYRDLLSKGKEGTIIKNPHAIWKDGTSKEQVKLKLEFEVELKVVGFEPGNGKNEATFGSLICESECGQLRVSASGIRDAKRKEIHDNRDAWIGQVITVRANSIMKPSESNPIHSLFLPRFIEERLDKSVADTLTRIFEQQEAAMAAA